MVLQGSCAKKPILVRFLTGPEPSLMNPKAFNDIP